LSLVALIRHVTRIAVERKIVSIGALVIIELLIVDIIERLIVHIGAVHHEAVIVAVVVQLKALIARQHLLLLLLLIANRIIIVHVEIHRLILYVVGCCCYIYF